MACHISRAVTGGIKGGLGFAEDTSDASIACRQVGPIQIKGELKDGEKVFDERRSVLFKELHVVRFYDASATCWSTSPTATASSKAARRTPSAPCPSWAGSRQARRRPGEHRGVQRPPAAASPKSTCCAARHRADGARSRARLLPHESFAINPLDPAQTTGWLYVTRWVTHLCAPTFVFLAGVSAYLQGFAKGKTTAQLSRFLLTRGLWLIVLEVTVLVRLGVLDSLPALPAGDLGDRLVDDRARAAGLAAAAGPCWPSASRSLPGTTSSIRSRPQDWRQLGRALAVPA